MPNGQKAQTSPTQQVGEDERSNDRSIAFNDVFRRVDVQLARDLSLGTARNRNHKRYCR